MFMPSALFIFFKQAEIPSVVYGNYFYFEIKNRFLKKKVWFLKINVSARAPMGSLKNFSHFGSAFWLGIT